MTELEAKRILQPRSTDGLVEVFDAPAGAVILLATHPILGVNLSLGCKPIDLCVSLILAASEVASVRHCPDAVFARFLLHHRLVFRLCEIFHGFALLWVVV